MLTHQSLNYSHYFSVPWRQLPVSQAKHINLVDSMVKLSCTPLQSRTPRRVQPRSQDSPNLSRPSLAASLYHHHHCIAHLLPHYSDTACRPVRSFSIHTLGAPASTPQNQKSGKPAPDLGDSDIDGLMGLGSGSEPVRVYRQGFAKPDARVRNAG